mmetsp:Transcript_19681/g.40943  ORF Transcript_19681/g.40943 Transcript_19681/m.40943 type:complete len:93 (-) Transcript_19681:143-421(-)
MFLCGKSRFISPPNGRQVSKESQHVGRRRIGVEAKSSILARPTSFYCWRGKKAPAIILCVGGMDGGHKVTKQSLPLQQKGEEPTMIGMRNSK